jgi:heme oxygenase
MLFHLLNVITAYTPNKFSKQIKKATKQRHDAIESHPFMQAMIDGSLSDFKYAIYLANLLPLYKAVEMFLFTNNLNPHIIQSKKILQDLSSYSQILNFKFDLQSCPQINFNNEWLMYFLSKSDFYKKVELYIRWLADMYGGQILKRNITFTNKYEFTNLRQCIQQVRQQIEQGLDETNVDVFIAEVNKAYEFHHKLADKIHECSEQSIRDA